MASGAGAIRSQKVEPMSLNITSRFDRGFLILTVTGNLTLGPNLKTLQQTVRTALDTNALDGVILDVSGIRYTDSAGLGELTILFTICQRKSCVLVLVSVPAQLRQMLELTRLDALLPSATDIEAAKRLAKSRKKDPGETDRR
jgi:anti-anti-sigma factor